jgi:replication factor A1
MKQGGMMEGQVPAWLTPRLLGVIKEDVVYYIQYFEVIHHSPTRRAVDHPFMARFTRLTKISEDTDVTDSFPMYAYKLSSYEVLRSRENNTVLMSGI